MFNAAQLPALYFYLAGCQVPTQATLSVSLPNEQGRKSMMNGSWFEIGTGRDHSHQLPSRAKQTQLAEISLIYHQ